jgi:hypothetical protein
MYHESSAYSLEIVTGEERSIGAAETGERLFAGIHSYGHVRQQKGALMWPVCYISTYHCPEFLSARRPTKKEAVDSALGIRCR